MAPLIPIQNMTSQPFVLPDFDPSGTMLPKLAPQAQPVSKPFAPMIPMPVPRLPPQPPKKEEKEKKIEPIPIDPKVASTILFLVHIPSNCHLPWLHLKPVE